MSAGCAGHGSGTNTSTSDTGLNDATTDAVDAALDVVDDATEDDSAALADATDANDGAADAKLDGGGDAGDAQVTTCSLPCHGSDENAAPPIDTMGNVSTTSPGVGAHQAHLKSTGLYRTPECSDCHQVPTSVNDPGHLGTPPAELSWGSVPTADGVVPGYSGGKCSVYCHGASLAGGSLTNPDWTILDGSQAFCGTCHGLPPPAPHPATGGGPTCSPCHPTNGMMPIDPTAHVNGKVDVVACGGCHAIPPNTGAHKKHYGDTSIPPLAGYGDTRTVEAYYPGGAPYYMFGCGNCHPLDAGKHGNGVIDVELYNGAAPAGSIKSKNPSTATYTGGKCDSVYCHSSGQNSPAFVTTPAWNGGSFAGNRCASCHADPPRYASGGAGSSTANSHVVMGDDGYEFGHFGGLPGPWHGSFHGSASHAAAPITCQACHYDTVDPANTGPGGLYWLDTTGNYDLGGSLHFDCLNCHSGAASDPQQGTGEILTGKHVNGTRDVVFDPRESIPAGVTGLPAAPNRPTYPYWATAVPGSLPPGSVVDGSTWSFTLANASYDAVTKTCSRVPCHLKQSFGTGKPSWDPLVWGRTPVGNATCDACHQF